MTEQLKSQEQLGVGVGQQEQFLQTWWIQKGFLEEEVFWLNLEARRDIPSGEQMGDQCHRALGKLGARRRPECVGSWSAAVGGVLEREFGSSGWRAFVIITI